MRDAEKNRTGAEMDRLKWPPPRPSDKFNVHVWRCEVAKLRFRFHVYVCVYVWSRWSVEFRI